MTMTDTVTTFISSVKQILAYDGPSEAGLARIADEMRAFVRVAPPIATEDEPTGNVHERGDERRRSGPLYTDDTGLTLVRGRFGPEALTPIHNHGSWGVIGVYKGRDRYQVWRRLDDGDGAGQARVELVEERILEAGDVVILPPPPQDIHAQQGMDGQPAYEFVLFGKNAMVLPRLYFDPQQGTAREVMPGR